MMRLRSVPGRSCAKAISEQWRRSRPTRRASKVELLRSAVAHNVPLWDRSAWKPLQTLPGDISADVCVVGLGGSGLSCIHELLDLGASVVGIDAGQVAGGAAGRNGGLLLGGLAMNHHDACKLIGQEGAIDVYKLTLEEIRRIVTKSAKYARQTGSLRIAGDEEELADCAEQMRVMQRDDLPVEWYSGPEGEGLLFSSDAVCNPLLRCRDLALDGLVRGAKLYENSPAISIESGRVRTPSGTVHCAYVIVLVDGNIIRIFPQIQSTVRNVRLQMLATAPDSQVCVRRPVYYRNGFEYWQQTEDGCIALGGLRDQFEADEYTDDSSPSKALQVTLEKFLRSKIRSLSPVTHRWAATVAFSNDGLPLVGQVKDGVWAAGAYSGTGNVIGALCGRALAQSVSGKNSALLKRLEYRGFC